LSGEYTLYATVCSTAALDEFYFLLLSIRFSLATTLLDVVARVRLLDVYINNKNVRTYGIALLVARRRQSRRRPDQLRSSVAHVP
jgi:hypothetical protein